MTDPNLDLVKQLIAALNDRDIERYLNLCVPEIELISPAAAIDGPSVGESGVRRFFAELDESARDFRLEVETFSAVRPDRVLATGTLSVTSERGVSIKQPIYNVYDLVDGKLRRVQGFFDRAEALAAASSTG